MIVLALLAAAVLLTPWMDRPNVARVIVACLVLGELLGRLTERKAPDV